MLFTKEDKSLLLKEALISDKCHMMNLQCKKWTNFFAIKNIEVGGCDDILDEAWNVLVTKDEGAETVTNQFQILHLETVTYIYIQ